jgi:hypothetical protein
MGVKAKKTAAIVEKFANGFHQVLKHDRAMGLIQGMALPDSG